MQREITVMTEQERTAYRLRKQGLLYREIAEKMGCSASTARELHRRAEIAIRWFAYYNERKGPDSQPVTFTLTRREWKLVRDGLYDLHWRMKKDAAQSRMREEAGYLPERDQEVVELLRRVDGILYKRSVTDFEQGE